MLFNFFNFFNILDWLYPPKCMVCNKIIPLYEPKWVCKNCTGLLEPIGKEICLKCGSPLGGTHENTTYPPTAKTYLPHSSGDSQSPLECGNNSSAGLPVDKKPCPNCQGNRFLFGWNRSPFVYGAVVQQLIYRFKYGNHPEYGFGLGGLICKFLGDEPFKGVDALVPIPLHTKREKKRGYNQALLLAKGISKHTGIPVRADILTRVKYTQPLSGLSPRERAQSLKSAFEISKNIDEGLKNILLIDDIFTTGSTVNSCTELLKKNGICEVSSITLAIVQKKKSIHCAGKVV